MLYIILNFLIRFQEIIQESSLKTDESLQTIKELQNEKDSQANSFKVRFLFSLFIFF